MMNICIQIFQNSFNHSKVTAQTRDIVKLLILTFDLCDFDLSAMDRRSTCDTPSYHGKHFARLFQNHFNMTKSQLVQAIIYFFFSFDLDLYARDKNPAEINQNAERYVEVTVLTRLDTNTHMCIIYTKQCRDYTDPITRTVHAKFVTFYAFQILLYLK